MVPGPNPGIWVIELIPGIMNTARESHRTRSIFSSTAAAAGIQGSTRVTSTGLNSRNIFPNPIDSLNEYQASEKEICYEAEKEKNGLACGFFGGKFYPGVRKIANYHFNEQKN